MIKVSQKLTQIERVALRCCTAEYEAFNAASKQSDVNSGVSTLCFSASCRAYVNNHTRP